MFKQCCCRMKLKKSNTWQWLVANVELCITIFVSICFLARIAPGILFVALLFGFLFFHFHRCNFLDAIKSFPFFLVALALDCYVFALVLV